MLLTSGTLILKKKCLHLPSGCGVLIRVFFLKQNIAGDGDEDCCFM